MSKLNEEDLADLERVTRELDNQVASNQNNVNMSREQHSINQLTVMALRQVTRMIRALGGDPANL
ncbi:MAG TPA: hypothetical protein VGU66_02765 [Candidatus Elarobacter sp.]|nr:hypothetical protein [Candidatus Elarobacter sp.]